ncbi:hypothetical protein BOX15_Mlig000193g3, partial [Macrostomum lignano]
LSRVCLSSISRRLLSSSSSSSLRSNNRISESVGPPDPRSCIRPVDVKISDELRDIQARCYRDKRLAAFDLCHKHWAAHNQAFKLAKDRFSIIKRTELAFAPEEQLMPDQMAEFYRQFLEQTRQGQYEFNRLWYRTLLGLFVAQAKLYLPRRMSK